MSNASVSGRLVAGCGFASAAAELTGGRVESGEFCDWFRGLGDAAADVDTMEIVGLGASLTHDDMREIFRVREQALAARVRAAKGKGGREKTVCPVSAGEFVLAGEVLVLTLPDGAEFNADPRVFKVGDGADAGGKANGTKPEGTSFGWQANREVFVNVNGKRCKVMLNVCGIIANSDEAPRAADDVERQALADHCGVFVERLAKNRTAANEAAARKAKKAAEAAAAAK